VATINPQDAYALALIAKDPQKNRDLVDALSPEAQPIGDSLVGGHLDYVDPEILQAAEALRLWAKRKDE
jgi:hypothetical protein